MCGIVGFFSRTEAVEEGRLQASLEIQVHRGPDGFGTYVSPNRQVALGHARLSIIDLKGGDQPLYNEDRTVVCVVNGEFYGFQQIRETLEAKGHSFRTHSDSEILLHLYEEHGAQAVQHLRGEFAFLLYDTREKKMIAGRDRFGIKPLFYSNYNGSYYFSSEIKGLLTLGVPARWDTETVIQSVYFNSPDEDRSFFKDVQQIPPGHFAIISPNHFRLVRYWDFDYPTQETLAKTDDTNAIEHFRDTLNEAIQLRLHADVPVGCYLSGGLDSCAVLGLASKLSKTPIHAFTLGFDNPEYDETEIAREMAEHCGARFQVIPIQADNLCDYFDEAVWHSECLVINPHGIAKYLLSRAVRDHGYKVVLTGEGSDEILAGYVHFRRDMLLHNTHGQEPKVVQSLLAQLIDTNKVSQGLLIAAGANDIPSVRRILGYVPSWIEAFVPASRIFRSFLVPQMESDAHSYDAYRTFLESQPVADQLAGRDPVNQSLYLWSKRILPNYILTVLGDRMEMSHSIEGRVPFLDHKVVEAATRLPIHLKINGLTEKYALREAAKSVLTKTVYGRQKHPFLAPPISANKKNRLFDFMQDSLRGPALKALPFIDARKVIALLDRLEELPVADRTAADPILTAILSATVLQKRFRIVS